MKAKKCQMEHKTLLSIIMLDSTFNLEKMAKNQVMDAFLNMASSALDYAPSSYIIIIAKPHTREQS